MALAATAVTRPPCGTSGQFHASAMSARYRPGWAASASTASCAWNALLGRGSAPRTGGSFAAGRQHAPRGPTGGGDIARRRVRSRAARARSARRARRGSPGGCRRAAAGAARPAMTAAAAPAPAIEPISTRRKRLCPATAVTTVNTMIPVIQPIMARAVAEQRDQGLREREGEDEEPAPGGEQREVELVQVELRAEEDLPDEGAERPAAEDAERANGDDDEHEVAHPVLELVVASRAHQAGELREQRGLHRLEQQDRDPGQEQPDDEVGDGAALPRGGEHLRAQERRVAEHLREQRPEQQVAHVRGQLGPRARSARGASGPVGRASPRASPTRAGTRGTTRTRAGSGRPRRRGTRRAAAGWCLRPPC